MLSRRALSLLALALTALMGVTSACGSEGGAESAEIKQIPLATMPTELLGLPLSEEKSVELIKSEAQPFIAEIGLFSMRKDDLLQATLQVSRFTSEARLHEKRFRDTLATQVSSSKPQELRMGENLVYMSGGKEQSLAVWFKDRTMYVLALRGEFPQPRALLRKALEIPA